MDDGKSWQLNLTKKKLSLWANIGLLSIKENDKGETEDGKYWWLFGDVMKNRRKKWGASQRQRWSQNIYFLFNMGVTYLVLMEIIQ